MTSKKIWGNATWYVIHTLAYKLIEDKDVNGLIQQILQICENLPCIDCRNHAVNILSKSNIKNINNKQQLILFLLQFHNIVNRKLNNPDFTLEEHNELYSRSRTKEVVKHFIQVMQNQNYNEKSLLQSYHRKLFLKNFIIYMNNNINNYNL